MGQHNKRTLPTWMQVEEDPRTELRMMKQDVKGISKALAKRQGDVAVSFSDCGFLWCTRRFSRGAGGVIWPSFDKAYRFARTNSNMFTSLAITANVLGVSIISMTS